MTTFADLVFSLGSIPCLGGAILPFPGNYWWVNETIGNDGYPGNTPQQPFATLARAQAVATANNNDVVFLVGTAHQTTTLMWAKNWVHLIGLAAPSANQRARISGSGTVFTPMVDVTAQGCIFANFSTFYGFDDASAQICWKDEGGQNSYQDVQFLGMGNATAAGQAGSRSLLISGSNGENTFDRCTIGLDTITRSTTNASLEFTGGSPRNEFRDCVFRAMTSSAAALHCTIGAGGIDRYAMFKHCSFFNAVDSTGTAMSVAFSVNAAAGGSVLLQDCASVGATVYATTGPIYVTGAVPTGNTSGLALHAT